VKQYSVKQMLLLVAIVGIILTIVRRPLILLLSSAAWSQFVEGFLRCWGGALWLFFGVEIWQYEAREVPHLFGGMVGGIFLIVFCVVFLICGVSLCGKCWIAWKPTEVVHDKTRERGNYDSRSRHGRRVSGIGQDFH
jgi:hypothetical protein